MEAFEIMISESQERMLAVIDPARTDEVMAVCERWETGAATIGEVTDDGSVRVTRDDELVADLPVSALVDECPLYDLEPEQADRWLYGNGVALDRDAEPNDILAALLRISEHGLEAMGVRAVRLDRAIADRAPAGGGGRGRAEVGGDRRGDRHVDRRQRASRRLRSVPRDDRGGAGVRPEPRLRRSAGRLD